MSGLLKAVLSNPELKKQLGELPADEQTIAIAPSEDQDQTQWKIGHIQTEPHETLDFGTVSGVDFSQDDIGFVPTRVVATINHPDSSSADYRIVGQLGSGGTGVVFQAHQRAVDREVAIKMLRGELADNQLSRNRFLTEARAIGSLDHPNVIAIHEVARDQTGALFYSMKRIDGTSWDERIEEMSLDDNMDVWLRVANAIRYAHSRGLVHRDIKPENVMLGRFGEVLMADWGLAVPFEELGGDCDADATTQAIGGTPAYMSPELAAGHYASVCPRSDIYLLGAVLFQILTGAPPHFGNSLLECIQAAANNEIRSTDVRGELIDIAMKAMATDPRDRFESVEEMVNSIQGQRQHQQSSRLVRRAKERLASATIDNHYEDYRVVDALLMEAAEVWPDNPAFSSALEEFQLAFAAAAYGNGDLDLSLSLYTAAGKQDSEHAQQIRDEQIHKERLRQDSSRYSTLFTQSPEAGLLIQMSTATVVEANEMFGKRFGYDHSDVVGKSIHELNLWACPTQRNRLAETLKSEGAIENFEATFLHTDGRAIEVLISGRVVDVNGDPMVVSTIRDITVRKEAEKQLEQNRHRLRDLQRLAGLATWSFDVESETVHWSEEAFALAGRPRQLGAPTPDEFMELIHPDAQIIVKLTIQDALESGASYEVHIRQKAADDQYQPLMVRGQPIFDADGNTVEIYGVLIPESD